jgi:CheY-like chemotaxis protein
MLRILIAEDDREVANVIATLVRAAGHDPVATVTTGGLDVLHLYDRYRPDVVLMDIMMPKFNGLTVCRAILSKNRNARVVLFSGKFTSDHPSIRDVGAAGFLSKPIDFPELCRLLEETTELAAA